MYKADGATSFLKPNVVSFSHLAQDKRRRIRGLFCANDIPDASSGSCVEVCLPCARESLQEFRLPFFLQLIEVLGFRIL